MALRPKSKSTVAYRDKVLRKKLKKTNAFSGVKKPSGGAGSAYIKKAKKAKKKTHREAIHGWKTNLAAKL